MGCNFLVFKLKERVSLSIFYKMCVCHYNINKRKMGDFYFGRKCYKAPVGCCKAGLVISDKQCSGLQRRNSCNIKETAKVSSLEKFKLLYQQLLFV